MSNKRKIRPVPTPTSAAAGARGSGTVAIGYLYGSDVAAGFANSLSAMLWVQAGRRDKRVVVDVLAEHSGVNISAGRNRVMTRFLEESTAEWLLIIDADMTFEPDLPDALLFNANPVPGENYAPIVGALCFGVDEGKLFPTLYDIKPDPSKGPAAVQTVRYATFPRDSMFQVAATGAACMLIHRSVVEGVKAKDFDAVYPWFQEGKLGDERCGEDITFCLRAQIAGFPIWVNTGVSVGHQKAAILTLDMYRDQRAAAGMDADIEITDTQVDAAAPAV